MGKKLIIQRIITNRNRLAASVKEAIIRRLPRELELRTNVRVYLRHLRDNESFWGFFTSPEYMLFLPELAYLKMPAPVNILDCGAGNGLFSLWIEHFRRMGVLDWKIAGYTLIEPSLSNVKIIRKNMEANFPKDSFKIIRGAVGEKGGDAAFYEMKRSPWSSSIMRDQKGSKKVTVPFVDLSPHLKKENVFLKLDIEGAEFRALENYKSELQNVNSLIIEWHKYFGRTLDESKAILRDSGLSLIKKSSDDNLVLVEFYGRTGKAKLA